MQNNVYTTAEKRLLDALGRGEGAARTQKELTALTGFDARTTRHILETARKKGAVICGSDVGRYLPETLDELHRYVRHVDSQVRNECAALAAARRLLKSWEGCGDD